MSFFGQPSEAGPSSQVSSSQIQYPERLADCDFLSYDEPLTPDQSISQQNTNQVACSTFSTSEFQPPDTTSAPLTLERVGPGTKKPWIRYSEMNKTQFIEWWRHTAGAHPQPPRRKVNFEANYTSALWKCFDQVAHHQTGQPMALCQRCGKAVPYPSQTGTLNSLKKHRESKSCEKGGNSISLQQTLQQSIQFTSDCPLPQKTAFNINDWERLQVNLITMCQLPFQFLARPEIHNLVRFARLSKEMPPILSPKSARRRLQIMVQADQQKVLSLLPTGAKISIALDCWTSPFKNSFLAITGYFIDAGWNYHEILLGFQPVYGQHTGSHLREILQNVLHQHDIIDRVLAVTTDNASNNKNLVENLHRYIEDLNLPDSTQVVRIPCLAHVIQLSLKDLLGFMKANPKNDTTDTVWSEKDSSALQRAESKEGIIFTLAKIRSFAVFINASPQRRERFLELQEHEPKLVPIQDVRTRWNSTYLMLRRANRLSTIFKAYCTVYNQSQFQLTTQEWRQIDYLLCITKPFYTWTVGLSKVKDVTIHSVFEVYNVLLGHFEEAQSRLSRKKVPWKQAMLRALEAGEEKLKAYYHDTEEAHGHLYAMGTILTPSYKLNYFKGEEWAGDDEKWYKEYESSLHTYLEKYYQRQPMTDTASKGKAPQRNGTMSSLFAQAKPKATVQEKIGWQVELEGYLNLRTDEDDPCQFWRLNESRFPTLAALARDVFSIPATGAGVERLFSSARDVCHYRRGSLNATTIQDLMMLRCMTRFDMEHAEATISTQSEDLNERMEADEEAEAQLDDYEAAVISDHEEEGEEEQFDDTLQPEDHAGSADDDSDELPLPVDTTLQIASQRPHRERKRRRDDDEYVYSKRSR